jgi:pimeloyl-ACP methyl ester carboxylesterase
MSNANLMLHNARITQIDDAGHFAQEDAHERTVHELLGFLAQLPSRMQVGR